MKAKKLAILLATVLGTTSLAACATNKKVTFLDYWKYDANSTGEAVNETMEYDVTFEEGVGYDSLGYSLSYSNGKYVTHLSNEGGDYIYTTTFTIDVTYQCGDDEEETFTDEVISSVRFSSTGMQPISSKKSVVSHSPVSGSPSETSKCYDSFAYEISVTYDGEGEGKTSVIKDTTSEDTEPISSTFEYGQGDYSYLDNEQLILAMRAISPSTTSGAVEVHNPYMQMTEKVNFSFASAEGKNFTYTLNGEKKENKAIPCRTVTLTLDSVNPGNSHTATIAATADNASQNINRNMLLQLETPLSFNIGKLVYTLSSATFA